MAELRKPSLFKKTDQGVPEQQREEKPAGPKVKRTFYLPTATVELLQELQFSEWQKTKVRPDLSDLVARAITLLYQHDSSPS